MEGISWVIEGPWSGDTSSCRARIDRGANAKGGTDSDMAG
jgi:hypothetical protein